MYLILFLMTCTPGGGKTPCTYQRVKEPLSVIECGKYLDGKLYDGKKMFFCGDDNDLAAMKRTRGMSQAIERATEITNRLASTISSR